ncbi:unnamed protein product, partial [Ectocarpus sp. 12 AP-2014]
VPLWHGCCWYTVVGAHLLLCVLQRREGSIACHHPLGAESSNYIMNKSGGRCGKGDWTGSLVQKPLFERRSRGWVYDCTVHSQTTVRFMFHVHIRTDSSSKR